MKWPSSIRGRFLVTSALTVGLALALTAALLVSLFSGNIRNRIEAELTGEINRIVGTLAFDPDGKVSRPRGVLDRRFSEPYGGYYWQIMDDARKKLLRSTSLWDVTLDLPDDGQTNGEIHHYTLLGPEGSALIVQERMITVAAPDGPRRLRIAVAVDEKTLADARSRFVRDILPALAGLALFLIGASIAQLAFGLKALDSLSEGIDRIRERRDTQLSGTYPSEFQSTVKAVNQLLETQELMIAKAKSRAADLAHGLRTPLTVLSNDALTLREKGEAEMADELEHLAAGMRNHVERELALARLTARPELRRADTDVRRLLEELIRTLKRTPSGENIAFVLSGIEGLTVEVDPSDFRELVGNLLENAVKWARSEIRIAGERGKGGLRLTISDDGPGVPEAALAHLTRRGWRLDNAAQGSGLGLSIVREIVEIYGISLVLSNGDPASGLTGLSVELGFTDVAAPRRINNP